MAVYTIEDTTLTGIADAIREKTNQISPVEYSGTISPPGGGDNEHFFVKNAQYKLIITPTSGTVMAGEGIRFSIHEVATSTSYAIDDWGLREEGKVEEIIFTSPIDGMGRLMYGINTSGTELYANYTITGGKNYKPTEMADAINELNLIPEEAFTLTGTGYSRFGYNTWNWFIEEYGDKITTQDLSSIDYMFRGSDELTIIPFDINVKIPGSLTSPVLFGSYYCADCDNLTVLPNIYITTSNTSSSSFYFGDQFSIASYPHIFWDDNITCRGFYYNCFSGYEDSEEPVWLFEKLDWEELQNYNHSVFGGLMPTKWAQARAIKEITYFPQFFSAVETQSYYHHWYPFSIQDCLNLKTITLPRPGPAVLTSSPQGFSQFTNLFTLKHLTFDVQEDGTPYTAEWKNITININKFALDGAISSTENKYMDQTKKVNSAETYETLKNDDEYWVVQSEYSGYNHDSAVETINSLPDTSAYLATAGGTNTIKFYSNMGGYTDGGAISNLTEEEIAVATAKGWTVSLV